MLSPSDIERLITVKRREIIQEKTFLGLSHTSADINLEDATEDVPNYRRVKFEDNIQASNDETEATKERGYTREETRGAEVDERIPPELERYIRRYLGLPVMLKAGEYSPNNPLVRAERSSGDVLLGLGEYERRRNTLRKIRQQQYREYLDQQAKKKQEEKERVERERREQEERERDREERAREREERETARELVDRDRESPRRRASVGCGGTSPYYINKVDTGVQVDTVRSPLSVAVQTDDAELFQLPPSPTKSQLTEAERELSPRTVDQDERRDQPAWVHKWKDNSVAERRRSYGDFDERQSVRPSRSRLMSELRHSYMPSIFDADAIHMRNLQAEKEAAERRQYYQQELKNQIMEQQRIKEERKTREKMLEQAEMRRLEEQLRMLKMAQERETGRQREITAAINEENLEYTKKRAELQKEIDSEQRSLLRVTTHPPLLPPRVTTSHSDSYNPRVPLYYPRVKDKPYSINIPENSIFSPNYDVDSYLRKNLNFRNVNRFDANSDRLRCVPKSDGVDNKNRFSRINDGKKDVFESRFDAKNVDSRNVMGEKNVDAIDHFESNYDRDRDFDHRIRVDAKNIEARSDVFDNRSRNLNFEDNNDKKSMGDDYKDKKVIIEKVLIHEPKEKLPRIKSIECDDTPIPVLRHSPVLRRDSVDNELSDAMQVVDDKWKVPAVQKNILRSLPNEEGKNVSILTQLGSIRRQLQLEQLKLDKIGKGDG